MPTTSSVHGWGLGTGDKGELLKEVSILYVLNAQCQHFYNSFFKLGNNPELKF
ncbi:MAG: hypothetical protein V7K50_21515 [Nostoc sp.]|uniref:hypothetical protein n=1 Tax=Nostoc sp. TaxID=1180 RepID=UPI002FF76A42